MKDGVSALSWRCQLWKITMLNWLFTHTSPAEQSQQEIPPPIFIFQRRHFYLLNTCRLTSKRRTLCNGVITTSDPQQLQRLKEGKWGAQLAPASGWPELLSPLRVPCTGTQLLPAATTLHVAAAAARPCRPCDWLRRHTA